MPLKFGLIGLGRFGKHYVRLLGETDGVVLVAVASRTQERINSYTLPEGVATYTDADALMADPSLDAVVIASPPSTHARFVIRALQAGKHVFVEKPMTTSVEDAKNVENAAHESGNILLVGHQYVYNDYIRHLKEQLAGGFVGEVKYVTAEHLYFGPIRYDTDLLWEVATHELAIMDYLFGPLEVASSRGVRLSVSGERADAIHAVAKFHQGPSLALSVSWFAPEKIRRMTFVGEKGIILFNDQEPECKLQLIQTAYPQASSTKNDTSAFFSPHQPINLAPTHPIQEPLKNQLFHFVNCIKGKEAPRTGIEHGMRITRALADMSRTIEEI